MPIPKIKEIMLSDAVLGTWFDHAWGTTVKIMTAIWFHIRSQTHFKYSRLKLLSSLFVRTPDRTNIYWVAPRDDCRKWWRDWSRVQQKGGGWILHLIVLFISTYVFPIALKKGQFWCSHPCHLSRLLSQISIQDPTWWKMLFRHRIVR